jgi:hypothetical protein
MSNETDIATILIAIYGAILGTIGAILSIILAIHEIRKGRRILRVTCKLTERVSAIVFSEEWRVKNERKDSLLEVTALNNGARPIQVTQIGLKMSDGNMYFGGYDNNLIPKRLEFSESCKVIFDLSEMEKELGKDGRVFTKAVVIDAEDKQYTARLPKSLKEKKLI